MKSVKEKIRRSNYNMIYNIDKEISSSINTLIWESTSSVSLDDILKIRTVRIDIGLSIIKFRIKIK